MDYLSISFKVAEMGLIAAEDHDLNEIFIVRPSSTKGTKFKGYDSEHVVGINNVSIKTDAPMAEISNSGKGRNTKFRLNISSPAVPGPGPVYFDETFKTIEELITAIRECYFSNRIDFNKLSLEGW